MRKEKYIKPEHNYGGDDINYAFDCNGLANRLSDIDVIVAEVCGENDGFNWHWILQMKDGTFSYATGGCDYTGWDCQSHADITDGFKTPQEAIETIVISEWDSRKKIKEVLLAQLEEKIPFAVYQEDIPL